jgi:hypothetical protein
VRESVWVSYDLGVNGDYEGMYAWLDSRRARECGDSVAFILYEHSGEDLLKDIKDDLNNHVTIDNKKNRIYVIRLVDGTMKGTFIFGRRRNAPWAGAAGTGEQVEDTNG